MNKATTAVSRWPLTIVIGLLLCTLLWTQWTHANADVEGVRVWRAPDHTRVVFDLSEAVDHTLFTLNNPSRLVVDVSKTQNRASLSSLALDKTPIYRIRSAKRQQNDLRFVFDLKDDVKPRSFALPKQESKPHRLVIDLYDTKTKTQKTVAAFAEAASVSTQRDILIVVDAGHGGEDPGAIGPKKTREKDVVLDIAKRLANKINRIKGYKAKLTRTNDYYIPLRKRRDFARKHRADLFVSIHADAFKIPSAKGASVFALSRRGATSETARFLAQKENNADLIGGVGDVSLNDKDAVLKGVLVDLSMTATLGSSLDAGKHILKEMGGIARLHKRQVEQAGFMVLKSPDVPSILVETGFISNPQEEKKLSTSSYRDKMAASILKGIRNFFEKNPPAGTYLANANKNDTTSETYRVASGDTLSEIAARHNMSVSALKQINKLSSNRIRIGQTLKLKPTQKSKTTASIHTVKPGDTLSEIALRYSSSVSAIRKHNKLKNSAIRIGQTLVIPSSEG